LVSFGNTSHPFTGGDFQKRKIWIIFTHRKNQLILQHKLPGTRKPEEPEKKLSEKFPELREALNSFGLL
jgi:hypothetical protein